METFPDPKDAVAVKAAGKPSALVVMANRLNVEPEKMLKTLKDTVFKGASESELLALVVVANEYELNPLLKEIYAFPAKGGGIQPVVSVDGWIKITNRHERFDGVKFNMQFSEDGKPYACTGTIHVKGRKHPTEVTEYYEECYRNTDPWKQMPRRMMRHKALIQTARVAFGFSGIQDEDEARDSIQVNTEKIPVFNANDKKEEKKEPKADTLPTGYMRQMREKLKKYGLPEADFCQGLTELGYDTFGGTKIEDLNDLLLVQLNEMDFNKLIKEIQDALAAEDDNQPSLLKE